ncbi:hypothetical protein KPL78_27155 [Roseomonas sp. HJA6]|uniref:Uncharacterized protein n=1 Tax=Roseomonas alba TaxID=2846776 RepID=A0ABS7AGX8_9PROT|nr:hypothetical protein [Neoroseomonas alba]MBW6401559.1 hypothetical protein [Neoroseomonas alba]
MTRHLPRRLLLAVLPLAGCVPPSTPTATAPAAPSPPTLNSLAALATVRFLDPSRNQATLELGGGSIIDMTAAPEVRNFNTLRPGARVVVEYEASGTVRIARAAQLDRVGRQRATVKEIAVGGAFLVLTLPDGSSQEVALNNPAMMAFATRLHAGDAVAVTIAPG